MGLRICTCAGICERDLWEGFDGPPFIPGTSLEGQNIKAGSLETRDINQGFGQGGMSTSFKAYFIKAVLKKHLKSVINQTLKPSNLSLLQ
jgi:hypothetical protein